MTSYDENLLASAPKATKAQLQDGYNPNILAQKPSSTPVVDLESAKRVTTPVFRQESAPLIKKKAPFYATKKGIVIIIVLVIAVIIAAVVGGVVGSRKKMPNADAAASAQENGSHTSSTSGSGEVFGTNTSVVGSSPTPTVTQGTSSSH